MRPQWIRWRRDDRGTALIEMAFTLPLLLLISIGIIEFGRAFQTWQVLTNAAREGARVAVLPGFSDAMVTSRVQQYVQAGVLDNNVTPTVSIQRNVAVSYGTGTATVWHLLAIAGMDPRDRHSLSVDGLETPAADPTALRIAVSEDLGFAPVNEDVRAAFRATVALLEAAGATLVEDAPGIPSSVREYCSNPFFSKRAMVLLELPTGPCNSRTRRSVP